MADKLKTLAIITESSVDYYSAVAEDTLPGICKQYDIPLEPLQSMIRDRSQGTHTVVVDVQVYLKAST